jgi:hypothetical protein
MRFSQGCSATAGSWRAARWAIAVTIALIWSEELSGSALAQNGAQPAGLSTGTANGTPPSGRVTVSSQSQSSSACGLVAGAMSSNTSKACSAGAGWLRVSRRSGSRPQL